MKIMTQELSPLVIDIFHGKEKIKIKMRVVRNILNDGRYFIQGFIVIISLQCFAHCVFRADKILFGDFFSDHYLVFGSFRAFLISPEIAGSSNTRNSVESAWQTLVSLIYSLSFFNQLTAV